MDFHILEGYIQIMQEMEMEKCVALSVTEAEYITIIEAGKEMLWLKMFLQELGLKQDGYMVYCDS